MILEEKVSRGSYTSELVSFITSCFLLREEGYVFFFLCEEQFDGFNVLQYSNDISIEYFIKKLGIFYVIFHDNSVNLKDYVSTRCSFCDMLAS